MQDEEPRTWARAKDVITAESQKRAQRDLQAIKDREGAVKDMIMAGTSPVVRGYFSPAQLGLRPIYADEWGRLWVDRGDCLERIDVAQK